MSDTASSRTNALLTVGWAVSAVVNVALMYALPGRETIPFHFVWIGLGIIYGLTRWSMAWMVTAVFGVALSTGWVLVHHAQAGAIGWEEVTEVPLMSALFGALVWHVRRRQQMLGEVRRLAAADHMRLDAQQLFVRLSSHELRTPITVARGYTELVRVAHPDPRTAEDTGIVLEELDKLNRITRRLVTLMQMSEPPVLERVDLGGELERIVHRWQPTADRQWSVSAATGPVALDRERFETALDCLVENAVKFTEPGDVIAVVGRPDGDTTVVEVTDSGSGMSPEDAALLLHDGPARQTPTGSGLGLAIVRAAVAARGGCLTIRSAPGVGTTISIRVPNAERGPVATLPRQFHLPETMSPRTSNA